MKRYNNLYEKVISLKNLILAEKEKQRKISLFNQGKIPQEKFCEIWQGWSAYSNWANSYKLIKRILLSTVPTKKMRIVQ